MIAGHVTVGEDTWFWLFFALFPLFQIKERLKGLRGKGHFRSARLRVGNRFLVWQQLFQSLASAELSFLSILLMTDFHAL